MAHLVVVDLLGQQEAVREHVNGWPLDDVLSWLGQFGTVERVAFRKPANYPPTYGFISASGLRAAFAQQPDGSILIFPIDH